MDAISALMDGELGADDARRQLTRLKEDQVLRARWDDFHLIGDTMRGETVLSPQFEEILSRRLAAEPTILAPRRFRSPAKRLTTYAMSAAASLGGVALVAWMALGSGGLSTNPPTEAKASPDAPGVIALNEPRPPVVEAPNLPSDGRMNGYLLAHQGFSPSTAIQGLAPYIRSVSTTAQITGR